MHPIMGNMPKGGTQLSQIEPAQTHVGVDLTGAIQLKKVGRRTVTPEQAYIVLYTCITTRSIYLVLTHLARRCSYGRPKVPFLKSP